MSKWKYKNCQGQHHSQNLYRNRGGEQGEATKGRDEARKRGCSWRQDHKDERQSTMTDDGPHSGPMTQTQFALTRSQVPLPDLFPISLQIEPYIVPDTRPLPRSAGTPPRRGSDAPAAEPDHPTSMRRIRPSAVNSILSTPSTRIGSPLSKSVAHRVKSKTTTRSVIER